LILTGNGLIIWQVHVASVQAGRLNGANKQLTAVLHLQVALLSFHQQLDDLARSNDARLVADAAEPLREALREQVGQTKAALAGLPPETRVDPAFPPTLEVIQITLPAQLDAIVRLANSGDWETVQRRLGNELRPIESVTATLVASIGRQADGELAQAVGKTRSVQRSILVIVPGTAVSTFCIALFLGWSAARRMIELRLEERVNERTRLARDLHDTLLQSFHGSLLHFQVVSKLLPQGKAKEQLEKALERADRAIAEGRSAVFDLRSSATTTNDLAEAVNAAGDELSEGNGASFKLMVEGPTTELHPIVRDEIYRISREAIGNAFKHAQARHIETEITYEPGAFRLRMRDDGQGIPAEILDQGRAGHFGLQGMRERARQIGAELTIWSRPGTGTEIELSLAGTIAYKRPLRRSRFRHSDGKRGES
jgi:signal transduction histidine kinase